MQLIQNDIETISAANSILEQDFEFEINKKNQSSKEIGQIINSINNIYNICADHQEQKKKRPKPSGQEDRIRESDKNIVQEINKKLEKAHTTADELLKVYEKFGNEYDREKAYAEDLE